MDEAESTMMRAVVLGGGLSGRAAAALLRREGAEVTVLEGDVPFPEEDCRLCVASPGIPPCHPWRCAARARGIVVVSELQLGAERWRARGGRMLAVTGSKGKSSVVKLVAEAVGGVPCGNYGLPLCEVVNALDEGRGGGAAGWAVVEVSSFQMETTMLPPDAFEAAAVLNLQEDHLDRHGDVAVYHGLKRRLLGMARVKVDGTAAVSPAPGGEALLAGSYFDNPVLRPNGLCAAALLRAACMADGAIAAAFARFEPLPHRMRTVCERGGVLWIDDSKATSIAALAAGVEMAAARLGRAEPGAEPGVLLVAGGLSKGDDPFSAIPRLRSGVKKVYLIGRCAEQLFRAWRETVPCEICGTLDRAVEAAQRDVVPGEAVLLSPGAASFDQFENYGVRGDSFAALVRAGA
jgi:UDP-N-acetylmuramoylalanine--D-glutamate ligase